MEHEHQAALMLQCARSLHIYPELEDLYAIPNGGHRKARVAAELAAEGVKKGIPDLCLPVPVGEFHGAYLEMKRVIQSTVSPAQRQRLARLQARGYATAVCYGWRPAWEFLTEYLNAER